MIGCRFCCLTAWREIRSVNDNNNDDKNKTCHQDNQDDDDDDDDDLHLHPLPIGALDRQQERIAAVTVHHPTHIKSIDSLDRPPKRYEGNYGRNHEANLGLSVSRKPATGG